MNRSSLSRIAMAAIALSVTVQTLPAQDTKTLPPPADRDPFVGTWRANAEKSRPKLSKLAASYVRTTSRDGELVIFSSKGGTPKARDRTYSVRCDGSSYPLPTGPILACVWVGSNRVEGETQDPGGRILYWAREINGEVMTITDFKDAARTKVQSLTVLDRVD